MDQKIKEEIESQREKIMIKIFGGIKVNSKYGEGNQLKT